LEVRGEFAIGQGGGSICWCVFGNADRWLAQLAISASPRHDVDGRSRTARELV
jgi:hypothetical protein